MENLIIMYKLKKNTDLEEYKKFIENTDKPTVLKQEGIYSFKIFIEINKKKKYKDYYIMEYIKIDNCKKWFEIIENKEMKNNSLEWDKFGDSKTIKMVKGKCLKKKS